MNFETPNLDKIHEEIKKQTDKIPDYQEDINKKELERIEKEYKESSEQEKPTEEPIKEKKDKGEDPEKNKKEGTKKGIKDENIIQKSTSENVKAAAIFKAAHEKGKFIEVKVKGLSGEIEDGWVINKIDPKTGKVTVLKSTSEKVNDGSFVDKIVTLEELKEWNKPETKESEGKKKENLEKEITKRYNEELEKIKDMPYKTEKEQILKAKKCFKLIEEWKNYGCSDNFEGVQKVFTELEKSKTQPTMVYYWQKKESIKSVASVMVLNYDQWNIPDKKKIKIINNFVKNTPKEQDVFYQKDKTLAEIAQILASKDIPYKDGIKLIVKNIDNPTERQKTIEKLLEIEKKPLEEKKKYLEEIKETLKEQEILSEEKVIEQLEKLGIDSEKASEVLSALTKYAEDPKARKKIQEVIKTKKFQEIIDAVKKITTGKKEKVPESVAKAKECIEKKESGWGTALGSAGWFVTLILMLFIGILMKGEDWLSGQATGKDKKK